MEEQNTKKEIIKEFTPDQEAQLPIYRDKWLEIGLSTKKCDRELAEKWAKEAYREAGHIPPELFIWSDSPKSCIEAQKTFDKKNTQNGNYLSGQVYGSHDAGWLSFYDYMLNVINIKECKKLSPLIELSKNCGWWAPYDTVCFLQEKPLTIVMEDGKLHNPNGPAITFRDGSTEVYSLFGVGVNKEMLSYDSAQIMAVKNAEQRMVLIKNIGLHNLLDKLSTRVLDTRDEYTLLMITLEGRECEFLKMINPSTGEIHVEGVKPGTTTVNDAMAFRTMKALFDAPRIKS